MEIECYANVENIYETAQTASRPPSIPEQDNNKATNKKTIFVVTVSFEIYFIVSVAAFVLLITQKANLTEANLRINKMFSISGWFRASNNLIYKRFTDSVNYATAKAQCEGMGARLVSTGIRNNKVKSEIFTKHYLTGAYAWIGLNDISNEGIWVWSDVVNVSPSKIWAPAEPTGGLNEDCAHMILLNSKLDVYDGGCTGPHRFVCESDSA
ncbi:lectin-like [Styela clava]